MHPDQADDWTIPIGLHIYDPSKLAIAVHAAMTSEFFDVERTYTASALASCLVKAKNKTILAAGMVPEAFVAKVEHLRHVSISKEDGSETAAEADA